jgi:hypothetical protein
MTSSSMIKIRQSYKTLARLVQKLEDAKTQEKGWYELRTSFRKPLQQGETLDTRLKTAQERESFLRILTPKDRNVPSKGGGRWVYKNGKAIEGGEGTSLSSGNVHSNWDGKNLDPCSVKRHNQQLKRMGFVNNQHAKGIF